MLDGALNLVAMGVRGGMGDMRTEETKRSGERSTDGFGVGAEGGDLVTSGVVGGDELVEGNHHVVVIYEPTLSLILYRVGSYIKQSFWILC